MSVNLFPDKICLKPAELYLLLRTDRMFWMLSDNLEGEMSKWKKSKSPFMTKRLKAVCITWIGLAQGSTRAEIIEKVKKIGYTEDYARKLVDEIIAESIEILNRNDESSTFHINVEPTKIKKGFFGKPGSKKSKSGRPPSIYHLESSGIKINKRIKKLGIFVFLLSGSLVRFLKLLATIGRDSPEFWEAAEPLLQMSPLKDKSEHELAKGSEDLYKKIDDWYNRLLQPIQELTS